MKLVGDDISGERQSARGRADAILKDKSGVYVFEFKYGKTAQEAVDQAREKDYAGPWLDGDPPVFLVGVNYDPAKRGIDDPRVLLSPLRDVAYAKTRAGDIRRKRAKKGSPTW